MQRTRIRIGALWGTAQIALSCLPKRETKAAERAGSDCPQDRHYPLLQVSQSLIYINKRELPALVNVSFFEPHLFDHKPKLLSPPVPDRPLDAGESSRYSHYFHFFNALTIALLSGR